jgi:hypothetical protein
MQSIPMQVPMNIPLLGQHNGHQQPSAAQAHQQAQQAIAQAIRQLSISIYAQAVAGLDIALAPALATPDRLRQLAADSMVAARAYFEGVGVLEVEVDDAAEGKEEKEADHDEHSHG